MFKDSEIIKVEEATILQLLLFPFSLGYLYLYKTKKAIIWGITTWILISLAIFSNLEMILPAIFILSVITTIDCYRIAKKHNEKAEEVNNKNKQHENKLRMKKIQKHIAKQKSKGLIKYKDKWLTKEKYNNEKDCDDFIAEKKKSNQFKGCYMICNSCKYVWKIKKDYGLPARCGRCNSQRIRIDKYKSYY